MCLHARLGKTQLALGIYGDAQRSRGCSGRTQPSKAHDELHAIRHATDIGANRPICFSVGHYGNAAAFFDVAWIDMNPPKQWRALLLQRSRPTTTTPGCPCACMRCWARRSWHCECTATPSAREGARAGTHMPTKRRTSRTPSYATDMGAVAGP